MKPKLLLYYDETYTNNECESEFVFEIRKNV